MKPKQYNKEWYKSKKLITAVLTVVFIILTDSLGVPISEETFWQLVTVVSSYIIGQSHVDAKKIQAETHAIQRQNGIF